MPRFLVQKVAVAVLAASQALPALASRSSSDLFKSYDEFRARFGRAEQAESDPVSYETRLQHYERSLAEIGSHNARPGVTWVAVVNRFADYTPSEKRALLGYKRSASLKRAGPAGGSFLETRKRGFTVVDSMDWRTHVNASGKVVHNQGGCGSCWAVAAVGALEMYAEMSGHGTKFLSYEQLVDCVPNPEKCGGAGGCSGATAELAFEYVKQKGLLEAGHYTGGYQKGGANGGQCPDVRSMGAAAVRAGGWERLEVNKAEPLLSHVANTGPAVVSVDASEWSPYGGGVFGRCDKDATVNHAVLLLGYGRDAERGDYWLIRNSWGAAWGEEGHIRLLRHNDDDYCGTDHDNQAGVGCEGDPKEVTVCGMCGILSDSSYPVDVVVPSRK